ncbi:MAG: phage portal protein [Clostridia bacterium]|nr:phage portal protein [Clostridia bacterium]
MNLFENVTERVWKRAAAGAPMSEREFFEAEIARWKGSQKRREMIEGERYYRGEHDILRRERTAIGAGGKLKKVDNLPNNRLVNNQYQRLVNQKVNYLLGRKFVIDTDCDEYRAELEKIFGSGFYRVMKCLLRDAINYGVAWLYPYANDEGKLKFRRIPAYEVLPFCKEGEDEPECVVRVYESAEYVGRREFVREKVEIYKKDGIKRYALEDGRLCEEEDAFFGGGRVPLVAFRYNEKEIPLIRRVKSLQDALNETLSDMENNLQEDARSSILVLQNYDGTDLGEFRQNLAAYGAVKVRTVDGAPGDIRVLSVKTEPGSFREAAELLQNCIIENAMGYDSKSDKLGNSPNQLAIRSMYSDLDLDMSEAETEFKASFERLRERIDDYLRDMGRGCFEGERLEIIFNRDCLINETEAIENCVKSSGLLSEETIVLQHPWVEDVKEEMERLKGENDGQGRIDGAGNRR